MNGSIAQRQINTFTKEEFEQVNGLENKVYYLDNILKNPSTINITMIAKDYGMSASSFNKLLANLKIQYKRMGQWFLYSKYQGKGYTHSQTAFIKRGEKNLIVTNTKWTQKR